MKKFIAVLLTLAIILSFTIPAVAMTTAPADARVTTIMDFIGNNHQFLSEGSRSTLADLKPLVANWNRMGLNEKRQLRNRLDEFLAKVRTEIAEKRAALEVLRTNLQPLFAEIKANNKELGDITRENKQLRDQIRYKLNYLKQDEAYVLPLAVKDLFDSLKPLYESLTATKGDIRDIIIANSELYKNLDFKAIKAAFEQIIAIQEARIVILTGINGILTQINDLLPEIPVPTPTPVPVV